jgi:glycosyltransferase involved in cell wall biosynthesis
MPRLRNAYVYEWRRRVAEALKRCDVFITTSLSARLLLERHFDFLKSADFRIIEHGRNKEFDALASVPPVSGRARVVIFGALGRSKGIALLGSIMKLNTQDGRPFEFHVLGDKSAVFNPEKYSAIYHGTYGREELPFKLNAIKPSFAMCTSIWPETYCHTLSEAWLAGIPVLASDIGTLRERIVKHGGGWLLDHRDPQLWYKNMKAILTNSEEYARRLQEVHRIQLKTVHTMAEEYSEIYEELLQKRQKVSVNFSAIEQHPEGFVRPETRIVAIDRSCSET